MHGVFNKVYHYKKMIYIYKVTSTVIAVWVMDLAV